MSGTPTEQPTPRRLRDARRRGQVARSVELAGAVAFASALLVLWAAGPRAAGELSRAVGAALATAATLEPSPQGVLLEASLQLARIAAPFLVVPALAAGAVSVAQTGGFLGLEPLRPRLDRLDPAAGLRRLASWAALQRTGLGLAKGALIGAILWGWFAEHSPALLQLPRLGGAALWRSAPIQSLAPRLALAGLALGALDLCLARRRHARSLRMTRDEVRRESKEDEGDPQHRAERRRLHQALVAGGPVSKATVVVVNPTHVAVALLHRRERDEPPRVLAKGTGEGAARIRSEARRAAVPVIRDVALARALYRLTDTGDEIPAELFEAAAAVLVHVYGAAREPL